MDIWNNILEAEKLIAKGDIESAMSLLEDVPYVGVHDATLHLRAARLLMAVGNIPLAVKEFELAVRDGPSPEAFLELSSIDISRGNMERAEKRLRKALSIYPENISIYRKLGNLYEMQGDIASTKELYRHAYEKTGNTLFKRLISLLEKTESQRAEKTEELLPEDIHLIRFVSLFGGREGVYARQWIKSDGSSGYSPIREPFTPRVAKNHILGNYTVGIYQLRYDNTINFMAFDIDVPKPLLSKFLSSEEEHQRINKLHLEVASKIVAKAESLGINAYIEDSGFKGKHVWIFFDSPITAFMGMTLGRGIISSIGEIHPEANIEIFPKQVYVKKDGLGALIKLPLGIHLRSGKRSLFVDTDGNIIKDQLSYLLDIKRTSKEVAEEVARGFDSKSVALVKESTTIYHGKPEDEDFSLEEDIEFGVIRRNCPVIATLYEKCTSGGGLTGSEVSVIVFTLGNLTNGVKIVNTLLSMAGVIDKKSYLKSKLNGNPMSCAKIRKRIPHITSNVCRDCFSGEDIIGYPTPLLHLRELDKNEADLELAVMEYLNIRRKFFNLKESYENARAKLLNLFTEHGIDEFKTSSAVITVHDSNILVEDNR
ncbi:MAG: hypothetical protein J7L41_01735 [Synergistetes bacterium]|nr:hypothetical protein [Synergistota bacterium]